MAVPNLRLQSYKDEWITKRLEEVCELSKGKELSKEDLSEEGESCILYGELYTKYGAVINQVYSKTNKESKSLVTANKYDVLIPSSGESAIDIACASSLDVDQILIGGDLNILTPNAEVHGHFLSYQINSKRKKKLSTFAQGATVTHLYADSIKKLECYFPSIEEQVEIASFISRFDKKVRLQKERITLLKEQKKGFMQKLFSQELRFKNEDGKEFSNWSTNKLSDFLVEHKIRNYDGLYTKKDVLSVSGEFGVVNQIKFQGRSFAGESVANYHVVHKGDIIYTKSPLKSNPYGIIKCNKGDAGIVSTMYAVYSCKDNINAEFLDYYFQLDDRTNSYLRPLVNKGAKNDMKVNNEVVLFGQVVFPSLLEQEKIVHFLNKLDVKIRISEEKLIQLQLQKKYYMQQMFI